PRELQVAILAGVSSKIAIFRHAPSPYIGPAQCVVSAQGAVAFFHPELVWSKLLPGPCMVHVLPWDHPELFRSGRNSVAQSLKFFLEQSTTLEKLNTNQYQIQMNP